MAVLENHHYQGAVPDNLTFDEESLFWRLRGGEGIPTREWHKPLDRSKTWHEIKISLDQKVKESRTSAIFQKIYPTKPGIRGVVEKWLRTLKMAFLMSD